MAQHATETADRALTMLYVCSATQGITGYVTGKTVHKTQTHLQRGERILRHGERRPHERVHLCRQCPASH